MQPGPRVPTDVERYARRVRAGGCFSCAMLAGDPRSRHHLLDERLAAGGSGWQALAGATVRG
jgi:hypothetical protein